MCFKEINQDIKNGVPSSYTQLWQMRHECGPHRKPYTERVYLIHLILFKGGTFGPHALTGDNRIWPSGRYSVKPPQRWALQMQSSQLMCPIQLLVKPSVCTVLPMSLSVHHSQRECSMAQASQTILTCQMLMYWNEAWRAAMRVMSAWSTSYGS